MGIIRALINFIMGLLGQKPASPAGLPAPGSAQPVGLQAASSEDDDEGSESESPDEESTFDLAGFDPDTDEDGFWEAMLYIESEGMIAPNVFIQEEDHEKYMRKWGVRDPAHWQVVKDSMWTMLVRKHGASDVVNQRMVNWRAGISERLMQESVKANADSADRQPVSGITLEQWAGINAAIAQGANHEDLLKGSGIDKVRWDEARTEWEARMARDTTFTIAKIYGEAFQAASKGKYAEYAKEATAARAANRDLTMEPPVSFEKYWEILYEQAYGSKQGKDPAQTLKGMDLSIVDWCDLSSFMGYHIGRTYQLNVDAYRKIQKDVEARYEAKYPGVKADVDISF